MYRCCSNAQSGRYAPRVCNVEEIKDCADSKDARAETIDFDFYVFQSNVLSKRLILVSLVTDAHHDPSNKNYDKLFERNCFVIPDEHKRFFNMLSSLSNKSLD